jgi:hypothetical protein
MLRMRTLPAGFIAPLPPYKGRHAAFGRYVVREIKHDGFRIIARKIGPRVNSQ